MKVKLLMLSSILVMNTNGFAIDATKSTNQATSDATTNKNINTNATTNQEIDCNYKISPKTEVAQETLLKWSEKAAIQTFNYNSENIDTKLNDLKKCFTDQGWQGYNDALTKSGNLDAIKSQKLTVSSQVNGSPQISTMENNKWQIKVPLQVVYQNDKEKLTQLLSVNMLISRKASGELGISQIIAAPQANKDKKV